MQFKDNRCRYFRGIFFSVLNLSAAFADGYNYSRKLVVENKMREGGREGGRLTFLPGSGPNNRNISGRIGQRLCHPEGWFFPPLGRVLKKKDKWRGEESGSSCWLVWQAGCCHWDVFPLIVQFCQVSWPFEAVKKCVACTTTGYPRMMLTREELRSPSS